MSRQNSSFMEKVGAAFKSRFSFGTPAAKEQPKVTESNADSLIRYNEKGEILIRVVTGTDEDSRAVTKEEVLSPSIDERMADISANRSLDIAAAGKIYLDRGPRAVLNQLTLFEADFRAARLLLLQGKVSFDPNAAEEEKNDAVQDAVADAIADGSQTSVKKFILAGVSAILKANLSYLNRLFPGYLAIRGKFSSITELEESIVGDSQHVVPGSEKICENNYAFSALQSAARNKLTLAADGSGGKDDAS